jgi:alginate O-acetyltransferase complex protein AlgI
MAIGLALMFDPVPRKLQPALCRTVDHEFWRRWHMSLSNWFRDYLYIPLGGNQAAPGDLPEPRGRLLITGLWHGAN